MKFLPWKYLILEIKKMQTTTLTGSPENFEMILYIKPVSVFITGALLLFGIAFGISALLVLIFVGLSKGILIAVFSLGYVAYLLFRMAFWNLYGKEIILYNGNSLKHQFDYRFFKSQPRVLPGKITAITLPELLAEPELLTIEGNESEPLDAPDTQTISTIIFHVGELRATTTLPVSVHLIESFFSIRLKHF